MDEPILVSERVESSESPFAVAELPCLECAHASPISLPLTLTSITLCSPSPPRLNFSLSSEPVYDVTLHRIDDAASCQCWEEPRVDHGPLDRHHVTSVGHDHPLFCFSLWYVRLFPSASPNALRVPCTPGHGLRAMRHFCFRR